MSRRAGTERGGRRAGRGAAARAESGTGGFLYAEVARELRRRIVNGAYPPGSRIPTEGALTEEFGVSAITVRRAIRDLTTAGLLVGRQGLGTFVADRRRVVRAFGAELRSALADDMRRSGIEPGFEERSLALVPCDEAVAHRLGLRPGAWLYRHEKVLLADGDRVAVDVSFIPRKLGDTIRRDLSKDFLLAVLRAHGVALHHMDYEFEAGTTSEEEGAVLGLAAGGPLIIVRYTVVAPDGRPIVAGRTSSRADRFTYQFCGHPEIHQAARRAP